MEIYFHHRRVLNRDYVFHLLYTAGSWNTFVIHDILYPPSRGDSLSVEDFIFTWTRACKIKPCDICGLTNAQCKMFSVYVQYVNIYL